MPNSMHGTTDNVLETEEEQYGEQSSSKSNSTTQESAANLVAVFVTRFDVHRGNVIDWQYPSSNIGSIWRLIIRWERKGKLTLSVHRY